ncbi:MAG TPA: hypothetical protein VK843_09750, partial [Planctomycetota bacterium]|nr:hypothetical protein [Planctomycetota bacterium]
ITQTFLARSDWGWLRVLAPLGDPRVLEAIDRELPDAAGDDEKFLQDLRKVWQAAADRIR